MVVYGHITFIGTLINFQLEIKKIIYLIHIPQFFLISGILVNFKEFNFKTLTNLLLPYFIFFSLYSFGLFIASEIGLPVTAKPVTSFIDFGKKIIVEPNGVYWFLHTLILFYLSCFISHKIFNYNTKSNFFLFLIINILLVYFGLVKLNSLLFFICGLIININGNKNFLLSGLDLSMLLLLTFTFTFLSGLPTDNLTSLIFNLLIFFLLYNFCDYFKNILKVIQFLGKNTLIILVLHPFFLLLMKLFSGFILYIDNFGIIFSIISLIFTCVLCILCALILDKLKLSFCLFGKKKIFNL